MSLQIRERPPLRLHATIATPAGGHYRWGPDEHRTDRTTGGLTFSSTMPGGFEQATLVLPRNPAYDYRDLEELSTVQLRGAGGQIAWEGRLETSPRTSGDQMAISPGLVGWQAHLDDDSSAREIYVDIDLTAWQGATVTRQILLLGGSVDETDASVIPDPVTGQPSLATQLTGPWARHSVSEGWYDAKGIPIGALYYAWKIANPPVDPTDTNWLWQPYLSTDDVGTTTDTVGNQRAAGPGSGLVFSTAADRLWAAVQQGYTPAAGADGTSYPVYWTCLAVYGTHGLPLQGTAGLASAQGVLCSDVEANAVGRWAPKLAFTTGANGTIQPSSFSIPQLKFTDAGTASTIIKQAAQYEGRDWAVWEGPTYWSNAIGVRGRRWRARTGQVHLQETGPSVSRLFNGVIVTYTDVTGMSRTVGPPGSGASTTDSSLKDSDPSNPANQEGINRYAPAQLGTSTPAGAIRYGQAFLADQAQLDQSGQASLVGYVQDDRGVIWPAWEVRGGDHISIVDANDPSYRNIVSVNYDDASKTNQLQLGAPPDGLQALLQKYSIVLAKLGLS